MQNERNRLWDLTTEEAFSKIIAHCKTLFAKKHQDYGSSWRIMRLPSITDQIYIKAQRIRTLQQVKEAKIQEGQSIEFVGIVNYCIIALIQIHLESEKEVNLPYEKLSILYDEKIQENNNLLANKNHDYDEAWRNMRVSSITDIILMKILRIKQIEDAEGKTLVSEGVEGSYRDILNYAIFCLIHLNLETE